MSIARRFSLRRWMSGGGHRSSVSVRALGTLEVLAGAEPIRRWGGDHAGSSQAEAVFALLFDRGERGVTKDELIDLIWPETDLASAEIRFHRTLYGLRRALAPSHPLAAIEFRAGRYRLAKDLIHDSDVASFEGLLERAAVASDPDERERALAAAVSLYRGEYLDDCPYYGDSAEVEERRICLRRLYHRATAELAAAYEDRGLGLLAAVREAQGAGRLAPLTAEVRRQEPRPGAVGDGLSPANPRAQGTVQHHG